MVSFDLYWCSLLWVFSDYHHNADADCDGEFIFVMQAQMQILILWEDPSHQNDYMQFFVFQELIFWRLQLHYVFKSLAELISREM